MPSYFIIELDTTSPIIEVYAPRYTTNNITNKITIESNENLAQYQDIYIIDSKGVRHDYTFKRDSDNTYVGVVKFSNYPLGIATIYARMKDEVDNFSNVASASIEIKENVGLLNLNIRDYERNVEINDLMIMAFEMLNDKALIENYSSTQDLRLGDKQTEINIKDFDTNNIDEVS